MPSAPRDASHPFRDEELLAGVIAGLIGDARHVAVGASSPIPAAAALLARERGNGRPQVSLLGSRRQSFFTDGGRDLSAREEERVDAALPGAVEQLAPAVGEEALPAAAQQRDLRPAAAGLARQQRRRGWNGRGRADRHVTGIADQAGNDVGKQLFVTERARSVTRRAGH